LASSRLPVIRSAIRATDPGNIEALLGTAFSGHVVAEERDGGGVAAVGHGERAAGVGAVLGIGERRLGAEGDVRQVEAVAAPADAG
jgi:hypothetical protein